MGDTIKTSRKRKHKEDLDDLTQEKRSRKEQDSGDSFKIVSGVKKYGESCPICLNSTEKKLLGIPKSCSHQYCLHCIKKWSKRKSTCPVCRKKYDEIIVRSRYSRRYIKKIPILKPIYEKVVRESRYVLFVELLSRFFINFIGNLFVVEHG